MPDLLPILDDEIANRVDAIVSVRLDWPCRKGCDDCCRTLAEPLRLTHPEWRRLEHRLSELSESARAEIQHRMVEVSEQPAGPFICPFLDREAGACRVYSHRPTACRMYGFYQAHDGGRYCDRIEQKVETEGDEGIVWGNHDAVDRRLDRVHGPVVTLVERLTSHHPAGPKHRSSDPPES